MKISNHAVMNQTITFISLIISPFAMAHSIEDLWDLVTINQIRSVEEFIHELPKDYKENYTLIYKTEALGQASFSSPRVLTYGENAQSLISIGSISTDTNYYNVEILSENSKTNVWESWVFQFDSQSQALPTKLGPNPSQCVSCHFGGGIPIWGSHPNWVGVFGSWFDLPKNPVNGEIEKKYIEAFRNDKWTINTRLGQFISDSIKSDVGPLFPYRSSVDDLENNLNFMPNMRLSILLSLRQAKALTNRVNVKFLNDNIDLWIKYAYCSNLYSAGARSLLSKKSNELSHQDQKMLDSYLSYVIAKKDDFIIQFLLTKTGPEFWSLEKSGTVRNLPFFDGLSGIQKLFANFVIPLIESERYQFEKVSYLQWLKGQNLILGDVEKLLNKTHVLKAIDQKYSFFLIKDAESVCSLD